MLDLAQLSHACTDALTDAEANGAMDAARFLRVQVAELFREIRHRTHDCHGCEYAPHDTAPATRRHEHG